MPLTKLDHYLIQTDDLAKTSDWYADALGMEKGFTPDFKFPVVWMYIGDAPVVHITLGGEAVSENRMTYLGQQSTETHGSGAVDHIAFRASGLRETMARLRDMGEAFTERRVDDAGLYQLFVFDPNGVKIELNFEAAEAVGLKAEVMASELEPNA
ncbi:MAG TPA: VOC family protein [Alphaproteobacteria bacterium]|nr:VOC family protein [Alphaproteobacteria bacterium]